MGKPTKAVLCLHRITQVESVGDAVMLKSISGYTSRCVELAARVEAEVSLCNFFSGVSNHVEQLEAETSELCLCSIPAGQTSGPLLWKRMSMASIFSSILPCRYESVHLNPSVAYAPHKFGVP